MFSSDTTRWMTFLPDTRERRGLACSHSIWCVFLPCFGLYSDRISIRIDEQVEKRVSVCVWVSNGEHINSVFRFHLPIPCHVDAVFLLGRRLAPRRNWWHFSAFSTFLPSPTFLRHPTTHLLLPPPPPLLTVFMPFSNASTFYWNLYSTAVITHSRNVSLSNPKCTSDGPTKKQRWVRDR